MDNKLLAQTLQSKGYSLTKQRQLLYAILAERTQVTIKELIGICNGQMDRVSVYRTIDLYIKLGIIERYNKRLELSDRFINHHHHLNCLICGLVIDVNEGGLEELIDRLGMTNKFLISSHQIEIQGRCSSCQLNN